MPWPRGAIHGRIVRAARRTMTRSPGSPWPPGSRGKGPAAIWRRARWAVISLCMIVAVVEATPYPGATAPASWRSQQGTPSPITTLTLVPDADAQVSEDNPDFNYGAKTELLIKGGSDPEVASYLRFAVSGVTAPVQRAT